MARPLQPVTGTAIATKGGEMWDRILEILNQMASQFVNGVVNLLPGVFGFLVSILLAVLFANVVSRIVRQSLKSIKFDQLLEQWGFSAVAEWSPAKSPSLLVARLCSWIILTFGFLIGLSAFAPNLTAEWTRALLAYLPHVLAAILVLAGGTLLAKYLSRNVLISAVNMQIQSARLLSLGVKWLVLVLTGGIVLDQLGIGQSIVRLSFAILFGGIVLALALAVGLGSKEMVTRWERQTSKTEEESEEKFHHL
ncbi:MAG: hypothetical protein HY313_02105 [Acidobacteria bacterium]|nr:hypothetical protein [Acidobacteriota bacterium]